MAENEEHIDEEEEEEEEDIPVEQKLKICGHFVKETCAGDQPKVIANLKYFFNGYEDDAVLAHLIARAEKYCQNVDGTILAEETKSGDGYINTKTKKVCSISVKNGTLTATEEGDAEIGEEEANLQSAMEKYLKTNYVSEASTAVAVVKSGEDLIVIISADRINLGAYWSGQMCSKWNIDEQGNLKGTIQVKTHYSEMGNVMFDGEKELTWDGKASRKPEDIAKAIGTLETEYQDLLTSYFSNQGGQIKDIRRALTIQNTKFDWRISQHAMVGQMG